MQAAGDAGAAGASEGRQGQRFVGRRGRHCQRGGLWKAEELVGSGELRRLAKGHLRDRRVDEGVFRRGGRGVEELGGQEDALLGDGQEEEVGGSMMMMMAGGAPTTDDDGGVGEAGGQPGPSVIRMGLRTRTDRTISDTEVGR